MDRESECETGFLGRAEGQEEFCQRKKMSLTCWLGRAGEEGRGILELYAVVFIGENICAIVFRISKVTSK